MGGFAPGLFPKTEIQIRNYMITFEFIDKKDPDAALKELFPLLFANMDAIAPTGEGYEKDFEEWFGAVRPAIEKPQRNIIVIRRSGLLVGFFQFYVNDTTFMMEEIQLSPSVWGAGVFEALYAYLKDIVPQETPFVEAYAHRLNEKSQGILRHLGLEPVGTENNCIHFRGELKRMFEVLEESPARIPEFTVI